MLDQSLQYVYISRNQWVEHYVLCPYVIGPMSLALCHWPYVIGPMSLALCHWPYVGQHLLMLVAEVGVVYKTF